MRKPLKLTHQRKGSSRNHREFVAELNCSHAAAGSNRIRDTGWCCEVARHSTSVKAPYRQPPHLGRNVRKVQFVADSKGKLRFARRATAHPRVKKTKAYLAIEFD